MARISAAKMTAGSIVATDTTAYIKTGDGKSPWNGTDGTQRDNAYVEKLLDNPFKGTAVRIGTEN